MRRAQQGDQAAFGVLFERYSRLVFGIALRILQDATEAEEALQDVFLHILRKSHVFNPGRGTVFSWVVQVAYSRSLNRRKHCRGPLALRIPLQSLDDMADPLTGPRQVVRKVLASRLMDPAGAELTRQQRETLWLYFFAGYTLREISAKRCETLGNTRHHYYRGIENLRRALRLQIGNSRDSSVGCAGEGEEDREFSYPDAEEFRLSSQHTR